MSEKQHICATCKHHGTDSEGRHYCYEDGDQVGIGKGRMERWCCLWKDEDDKTPDIDWP